MEKMREVLKFVVDLKILKRMVSKQNYVVFGKNDIHDTKILNLHQSETKNCTGFHSQFLVEFALLSIFIFWVVEYCMFTYFKTDKNPSYY
jgi:hypothetical protein